MTHAPLRVRTADVPDGGMASFPHGDRKVLVVRDGDELRAFDAKCPHAGADLGKGLRCGARVVCPWHHATFSADDGHLLEPPALDGLKRYALTRDGDAWEVAEEAQAPAKPPQGAADGHTLVVGGGAAGFMVAQSLRAAGYTGDLTMVTQEERAPYDRTALSKAYLTGKKKPETLPLGGGDWAQKQRVTLRSGVRAEKLDHAAKKLHLAGGEVLPYDRVVVATGASPKPLKVPGADLDGVYPLRSLADAEALRAAAQGARVVVVGSSFIGLEAASSLVGEGGAQSVTVVGQDAEVLGRALTPRVGRAIRRLHEDKGVRFVLEAEVERLDGGEKVEAVALKGGERLDADLVLLGIGVSPNTDLLAEWRDEKGAVHVDAALQLAPDLYALGDIAAAPTVLGEMRVEHWRVALQHGLAAAQAILDVPGAAPMDARVPFFWTQQYGKSLRYVGHAESLDETHLWGDPDTLNFIEFTFDGERTVAASGMGRDADLVAFEELLRLGRAPGAPEVRAGEFSLPERLQDAAPSGRFS
ncbi:FAD-dependent oxidoreductase [uncultured Deinococcus sp.]|uniref:FAD-dependent oxidoreductase n=1 Tax=uncultured Deinococcus sp. TaxID=158789 RepID=UPI002585E1F8|nr:FAD-dependent oxidoreductase [uncultured Deinococcus sp.]